MRIERKYRQIVRADQSAWGRQLVRLMFLARLMARVAVTRRGRNWRLMPELQ